jgi:hypothetical protein
MKPIALEHSRFAAGDASLHVGRHLYDWRQGGLGMGAGAALRHG